MALCGKYAGQEQNGSLLGRLENNLSVREMLILRTDIQGLYTLSQSCYNCYILFIEYRKR